MAILKQLVDLYKQGDKVAILYSTTSGRTSMIQEDAYQPEEYHNMASDCNLDKEKEIIVDSAEHLEFAEVRKLAHIPGKVILLFDQVGGLNGLTIDQLRTLGYTILVPSMNEMHAAGGDAYNIVQRLISKTITKTTSYITKSKKKTKVVTPSKLKNPIVISNDYDEMVKKALNKDMPAISELATSFDGIGKKTSADIANMKYNELAKYAETLKEDQQKKIKHMINAVDNGDAFALSKLTGKQITLNDALFGKAIGINGANARRDAGSSFFHTFDQVLVDLERYEDGNIEELDESYAVRLYYAVTRATGSIAFSNKVDKSIIEIEKKVVKSEV